MGVVCKCDNGLVNSGIPNCVTGFGRIVKLFFIQQVASDGTSNAIPCTQVIDEAFLTSKLNEIDPSKRLFPTGIISTVTEVRNDSTTETIDNVDRIVSKGARTFEGFFVDNATASPEYLKFLKSAQCTPVMYYAVDPNGTLVGIASIEEDVVVLTGLKIQQKSMDAVPVPATSSTVAKNRLTFTLDQLVLDEDIAYISSDEITANLLEANGLQDVTLAEVSTSTTEIVVSASFLYGSLCTKIPLSGAEELTDWDLQNLTTVLPVPIVTAVENPTGTYTLTFAAQTALDDLSLTLTKEKYSQTNIEVTV